MNNNNVEQLLSQIKDELEISNYKLKQELLTRFTDEFLTTPQKKAIFNLFNGEKSVKDIMTEVGCSDRAVQRFIKDLTELNLIETNKNAQAVLPKKNLTLIAKYYVEKIDNIKEE